MYLNQLLLSANNDIIPLFDLKITTRSITTNKYVCVRTFFLPLTLS